MPVIQCNGADLYYEDEGTGVPIVFLHGAWAGIRFFDAQLGTLSERYRTVAFDFSGHRRSEKTESGHTVGHYARDVEDVLDQLVEDEVVLVGWSLGALVAWEYVDRFGTDRLRGVVNVDMEAAPGPTAGGSETYDLERFRDIHRRIQTDHLAFIMDTAERSFKDPPSEEVRTLILDEDARSPPWVKSAIVTDATLCDFREVLPQVDVPMLVCAGADEKWRSVPVVEHTAELVPEARFELFEESGHFLTVEEPDKFNRVVGDFVETL